MAVHGHHILSRIANWLQDKPNSFLTKKSREAETIFRRLGITFAVYGAEEATERLIPFDPIPQDHLSFRVAAAVGRYRPACARLNAFLHDIYHRQEIIRAGRIPANLILQNEAFLPEMAGFTPARKVYAHIIGTDLVRVSARTSSTFGGQHAHPVRRFLHDGKPGNDDASVPGTVSNP
jgi:uncharacterized circularly permuted ATP-grasp superfamily protein